MVASQDTAQSGFRGDDRSISEVVGFVLMFGIILTSVGLVSTVGLSQLNDFEQRQQLQNAEQTIGLVAASFDEVEESQTPVRTEAMDLAGGSVTVDQTSSITVRVRNDSGSILDKRSIPLNAFVYENGDTVFAYENGAAFRSKSGSGGIMFHEPGFVCDGTDAVVSLVTVKPKSNRLISGESTLQITGRRTNTSLLYPAASDLTASDAASVELDFEYTGEDRLREWRLHFDDEPNWSWDSADGSATCGGSLDRVYVRQTVISISYS